MIIAFGVWRINLSTKSNSQGTQPTPTPESPVTEFNITLNNPSENDVEVATPVIVSGITKASTWVAFSGEKGDYLTESDTGGIFSKDIDLAAGVNQIKVTALDSQGNSVSQKVLVVYSSSFQTSSPSATPSTIQEKVSEKVAQAQNQPKAYIGTVTDIADSTIQIKSLDSQIEQIAIGGDGITALNTKGTNNKTIKLTDIAIGDFIVAMGYVNANEVLNAQRILVTDPVTEPEVSVSLAKVTDTSKKSITISDTKTGSQSTLTPDKNTDLESFANGKETTIKLTSINKGDAVIYVSDQTGTPAILRSIFDLGASQN